MTIDSEELTAEDIVERIMSAHWDLKCCDCWVCHNGRKIGLAPKEHLLSHRNNNQRALMVPAGWDYDQFLRRDGDGQ